MARSHARITTGIWADRDFTRRSGNAQRLYFLLVSQPDLNHAGVLSLTIRRWALLSGDRDEQAVRAALAELAEHHFVVVDYDTEELLIRTLIRNDGVWKQPKVLAVALLEAERVASRRLRHAVADELERIPVAQMPAKTRGEVTALLTGRADALREGGADPLPYDPPQAPAYPPPDGGAEGPRGMGSSYGEQVEDSPTPSRKIPHPHDGGHPPADPPSAAVQPGPANPHEGEAEEEAGNHSSATNGQQRLTALVADIRTLRPEWSSKSIRRAATEPSVAERPWPAVRHALLTIARDPMSQAPGRVKGDGPWWHQPSPGLALAAASTPPSPDDAHTGRPPWCGTCDERTRHIELADGRPARCQQCHPNPPNPYQPEGE